MYNEYSILGTHSSARCTYQNDDLVRDQADEQKDL